MGTAIRHSVPDCRIRRVYGEFAAAFVAYSRGVNRPKFPGPPRPARIMTRPGPLIKVKVQAL